MLCHHVTIIRTSLCLSTYVTIVYIEVQCLELVRPNNGNIQYSENPFGLGTVATYECDPGYNLMGLENRTCGPVQDMSSLLGVWSGTAAICEGMIL